MAEKKTKSMPGMDNMPGMSKMPGMGDPNQAVNNSDPTKNQQGMDTPPPPAQAPSPFMQEGMKNMPMATPKRVWTVTGTEDWEMLRGFGPAAGMVAMMNGMMIGGGSMQSMKMGKMDVSMAEMPAPTPEQARAAAGKPAPTPEAADPTPEAADPTAQTPVQDKPVPETQAPAAGPLTVAAALSPQGAKVGDGNLMTVTVTDTVGKPVTGATVTASVAMTTMDMGTTHPAFKDAGGGKYQGTVGFGMAGPWRVTVKVITPGRKPLTKAFTFNAK